MRFCLVESTIFSKNSVQSGGAVELIAMNTSVIRDCLFTGNSNLYGGTVFILKVNTSHIYKSIFVGNKGIRGGALVFFSEVIYSNITFCDLINNSAIKVGGAISINNNGNVYIKNCNFKNNTASILGSTIYNVAKLSLVNTTIESEQSSTSYVIHSQIGSLNLENVVLMVTDIAMKGVSVSMLPIIFVTSAIGINVTNGLNISCPINHNVDIKNNSYNAYKFHITSTLYVIQCRSCSRGTYSIDKGKVFTTSISENAYVDTVTCYKCPNGGTCHSGIKAMDNFWGYQNTSSQKIEFLPCPLTYCCSNKTNPCSSYNTCNYGRTGILCGTCIDNFTQGFLTTKCLPINSVVCNVGLFCTYFICYSLFYTLFWMYITSVSKFIKKIIVAVKMKCAHRKISNGGAEYDADKNRHLPLNLDSSSDQHTCISSSGENVKIGDEFLSSGLLKLLFYYYQIASLINVELPISVYHTHGYISQVKKAISGIFNFRFIIYQNICPTNNLNKIDREFMNFALELTFFLNLFIFYVLSKFIHVMKSKIQRNEFDKIASMQERTKPLLNSDIPGIFSNHDNFANILKRCFIKLLSLTYIPFATFAFNMVNCVDILGNRHLYIFGDFKCYVWWQKVIYSLLIPWILFFPLSAQISKHMIKKRQVSIDHYLLMNVAPPYTIYFYAKKCLYGYLHRCSSENEAANINAVMHGVDNMFRSNDDTLINWRVVLLIRSLAISAIKTFFINPVFRLVLIFPIFGVCLIHDTKAMPFKHRALNGLQIWFSFCLLVLTMCNEVSAFSYMNDISGIPGIDEFVNILNYVKNMLIFLPLPLWMVGWGIWTKTVNKGGKGKQD